MDAIGARKLIFVHPWAVPVSRTMSVFDYECFETAVCAEVAESQGYVRPDHRTADDEPGLFSFPRIVVGFPEFRDGTDHLSGDNIELQAEPLRLKLLSLVVEPQAPFVGP